MKAVVPAAGEGTRLRPLTETKPKPLVEVGGEPILAHCFRTLQRMGVEEAIVVVGYRGDQVRERFGDRFGGGAEGGDDAEDEGGDGLRLRYVEQAERLGLAHAVAQAAPHVVGDFVVLNGDNVMWIDADPVLARARDPGVDGVLVVEEATVEEARETGVVETRGDGTDDSTAGGDAVAGEVAGVVEKPDDPQSRLVQTGLFALPAAAMDACRSVEPSARGEHELADAIERLLAEGYRFEAVRLPGWRVNVNRPGDVDEAERRLDRE